MITESSIDGDGANDSNREAPSARKTVRTVNPLSVRQIMEGKGVAVGEEHDGSFHTYMAHKISKLQNCNIVDHQNMMSEIFRGCFVYINGSTEPPVEELRRLLIRHGGVCDNYKTSRITHFACNNFTDAQLKNIREKVRIKEKLIYVTTYWILQSISKQKKQSESDYSPIGLKDRHGFNIVQMYSGTKKTLENEKASENKSKATNFEGHAIVATVDSTLRVRDRAAQQSISTTRQQQQQQQQYRTAQRAPIESRPHPRIASVENEPEMFLKQYFAQSRLHFIGSWRNRLPSMVNRLLKMKKAQAASAQSGEGVVSVPLGSNTADIKGALHERNKSENKNKNKIEATIKCKVDKELSGAGVDLRDPRDHHDDDDVDVDVEADSSDIIISSSEVGSGIGSGSFNTTGVTHSILKGSKTARVVIHLDMDCFFVSAVLRSEGMKHLRDLPVAVAHSADTSYNNTTFTPGIGPAPYPGPGQPFTSPFNASMALPTSSSFTPSSSSSTSSSTSSSSFTPGSASSFLPSEMRPPSSSYPPVPSNMNTSPVPRVSTGNTATTSAASTFSSSSEISSCNYPARLSGI